MADLVDQLLSDVADHVEDRLDNLVDAILHKVDALPGYSSGRRPGDSEDIRAGFRNSTRLFLACLRHDRDPTADELRHIALIGAQRARQGLPRESVSESLDHAQRIGFEFVLHAVQQVGDDAVRLELTSRAWVRLSDFMTDVRATLLRGYDDAQGQPFTGERREALVFVDRLLGRRWTSEAEIRSHASSAGVVLGRASALLLVMPAAKQSHETLLHASQRLAATVPTAAEGAARWSPTFYTPVLVGQADDGAWAASGEALARLCAEFRVSIACIGPMPLTDLADEFARIEAKLHHLPGARRMPGVVDGRELDVLHLLSGEASFTERVAFVRRVLGPVLHHDQAAELLAVLDAVYTTNGSAATVAAVLHMNKSTVLRRFRAIEQATGRRLGIISERYELLTATRLQLLLSRDLQSVDRDQIVPR